MVPRREHGRAWLHASYRAAADRYDRAIAPTFAGIVGRVAALLEPLPDERVLDAGTGTARVLEHLIRMQPRLQGIGIDLSRAMLQRGRTRIRDAGIDLRLVEGVVECLPFAAEQFDAATCVFALHHFDEPASALAELRRVLRPSGRLVLATWGETSTPQSAILAAEFAAIAGAEARSHPPGTPGGPEHLRQLLYGAGFLRATVLVHWEEIEHESALAYWEWYTGFPGAARRLAALGSEESAHLRERSLRRLRRIASPGLVSRVEVLYGGAVA